MYVKHVPQTYFFLRETRSEWGQQGMSRKERVANMLCELYNHPGYWIEE